jgi:hypothetical protein
MAEFPVADPVNAVQSTCIYVEPVELPLTGVATAVGTDLIRAPLVLTVDAKP